MSDPTAKTTTMRKAIPSKPAMSKGSGLGGNGGGTGQLASQSMQLHAKVSAWNKRDVSGIYKESLYNEKLFLNK